MAIRTLRHDTALDTVSDELIYTEARLTHDPVAKTHASTIAPLVERTDRERSQQRALWRAEIIAQAGVDARDVAVDIIVDEFEDKLFHAVGKDRSDARYKRYFTKPKGEIIRLGLESEIDRVKSWPDSLKSEPEAELKSTGRVLANEITAGTEAIEARRAAIAATADHRARQIVRLIDDVNATRLSLYSALVKLGVTHKLPKSWADGFFRHAERGDAGDEPAGSSTPPAA